MTTPTMKPGAAKNAARLTDLLNSIPALSRGDLITRWCQHYGGAPPKAISTRLLTYAVAYAIQVELYGGLSKRSRKELLRWTTPTRGTSESSQERSGPIYTQRNGSARPRSAPSQGTRFVREWNGRTHIVEVADKGFVWQGKTYRSLSVIASTITGSRWSGPRFFGLT